MKTKKQYLALIAKQIDKLSAKIDFKIAVGKPYTDEANEHKRLLALYNSVA